MKNEKVSIYLEKEFKYTIEKIEIYNDLRKGVIFHVSFENFKLGGRKKFSGTIVTISNNELTMSSQCKLFPYGYYDKILTDWSCDHPLDDPLENKFMSNLISNLKNTKKDIEKCL